MAYDAARKRVVLFGGNMLTNDLADTWEWDGTRWTNVTPSTSPSPRELFAMVYDSSHARVVLFGGFNSDNSGTDLADTWAWDGTGWGQEPPGSTNPAGRDGYAMAFDGTEDVIWLFGGSDGSGLLDDTWEHNAIWSDVSPASGSPPSGSYSMAYDAAIRRAVLYSGGPDIWEWDGSAWTDVHL